ncbi:MAG: hypothetical protein NVV60_12730 [Luteimonas sp.]|nr:hypothetical protein [Luteimonas sp.]
MAFITGCLEGVVQLAHALGGLHVDRVFFLVAAGLVAADEAEAADFLVQVGQREFHRCGPAFKVVQPEPLEIADQDALWFLGFVQPGEVIGGLVESRIEIHAGTLVFGQQLAGPEQVDAPGTLAGKAPGLLLVHGHAAAFLAEHVEEVVPETLGLGPFRGFAFPLLREGAGAIPDFVEAQHAWAIQCVWWSARHCAGRSSSRLSNWNSGRLM